MGPTAPPHPKPSKTQTKTNHPPKNNIKHHFGLPSSVLLFAIAWVGGFSPPTSPLSCFLLSLLFSSLLPLLSFSLLFFSPFSFLLFSLLHYISFSPTSCDCFFFVFFFIFFFCVHVIPILILLSKKHFFLGFWFSSPFFSHIGGDW